MIELYKDEYGTFWWKDERNNIWDLGYYNFFKANVFSSSLIRCKDCANCTYCTDCSNLDNCSDCKGCEDCIDCEYCEDCLMCFHLRNCEECIDCSYSENCTCLDNETDMRNANGRLEE